MLKEILVEASRKAQAAGIETAVILDALRQADTFLEITAEALPVENEPPFSIGWVTVDSRAHVAHSVKLANMRIRPPLAARNVIVGATASTALVAASNIAFPLACLTFLFALHFARRHDITYEQGCVLALAWNASEYIDGKYVFAEQDLLDSLSQMTSFGVYDFNTAKARTALSNLSAWGMMKAEGPAYTLLERVSVKN